MGFFLFLIALSLPIYAADTTDAEDCSHIAEKLQPSPEMIQGAMSTARDRGFLWSIRKDGHTSFLYGTIHVAKFDWMFPGPGVMQALRTTDTLALELDILDEDIQGRMAKGMTALRNTALPELLVQRMRQQADSECVSYDSIAKLTPELQITLLTLMLGRGEGLDASYAIDSVLAGIGHSAKKKVVSLETPELQLQLLQMKSSQETLAFVQNGLDELKSGRSRTMLNRIAKVWANADYTEMARFSEWCECLNTEIEREMMKRMLDQRNPALADSIDALHHSGKQVFAAVGSLHMFGPMGLPTLMAKRGYTVESITLTSPSN